MTPNELISHRYLLESKIFWSTGTGICRFAGIMAWALDEVSETNPDYPSVVTVSGPPDKYTDEELEKLVAFSEEQTANYDRRWTQRRGCKFIVIDKAGENRWLRKRMTWESGVMYSSSLDEAMAVFSETKDWSKTEE